MLNENHIHYLETMSVIRQMWKTRLITDKEYAELDTIMLQKYDLSLCSILSDNRLISPNTRGNMSHCKEVALCQR